MPEKQRFVYAPGDPSRYEASLLPRLPLTLRYRDKSINVYGLLDTGSTVNVLPYPLGIQLGARWEDETTSVRLTGNLGKLGARPLLLNAIIGTFEPVELVFAWTRAENVPVILGQYNFSNNSMHVSFEMKWLLNWDSKTLPVDKYLQAM